MSKRTIWALVAGAIILAAIFAEFASFIENHEALFTVASGAAVAAFTGTLWWSTRKLWTSSEALLKHGQDTAQRQLRAYLDFDGVKWRRAPEKDKPDEVATGITLCIKNYGHTPASELVLEVRYYIQDVEGGLHALADEAMAYQLGSIAPTDHCTQNGDFPMPPNIWATLTGNLVAFISDFKVTYKDAFEASHTLESRFRSQGTNVDEPHTFIEGTRKSD